MKDKSYSIYFVTVAVIIFVYAIIVLFGSAMKKRIYEETNEYVNNISRQPINNIFYISQGNNGNNNQGNNNQGNNHGNNNQGNNNQGNEDDNGNQGNEDDDDRKNALFELVNEEGDYIDLNNQFPTKDEVGMNFTGDKYTQNFKIRLNEHSKGIQYTITAIKLDESDLSDDWVKVYLSSDGTGISNCFRPSGRIKTYNEYGNYQTKVNERVLYRGTVTEAEAKRGYKNFTLRMWISEDIKLFNEAYLSKNMRIKVGVYAQW